MLFMFEKSNKCILEFSNKTSNNRGTLSTMPPQDAIARTSGRRARICSIILAKGILMTIRILYFSGTGCTRYVAKVFEQEISSRGHIVQVQEIRNGIIYNTDPCDLLIICFVVHAANPPHVVIDWISKHKKVQNIPAVVISVSGGGEVTPNLACRVSLKKKLEKKQFKVIYEKMLIMPSNWIVSTKPILINMLLKVLPNKIAFIVEEILTGKTNKTVPKIGNRILSFLGKLENIGAKQFGKKIIINKSCKGCSLCSKKCPMGNIEIINNKPEFNNKCIMCLNCLYICPEKALVPGIAKFVLIKEGFSFDEILKNQKDPGKFDIKAETRGFLWVGLRRYLLNTKDMLNTSYNVNPNI